MLPSYRAFSPIKIGAAIAVAMLIDKGLVVALFLLTHDAVIHGRELFLQVLLLFRSMVWDEFVSGRLLFTILIFVRLNQRSNWGPIVIALGYLGGYVLSLILGFAFQTPAFKILFIGNSILAELWVITSLSAILVAIMLSGYFRKGARNKESQTRLDPK